jgi:hypothetical protein
MYENMTDHELVNACSIWSKGHRAAHIAEIEQRRRTVVATLSQCETEEEARIALAKDADFGGKLDQLT